MSAQLPGNELPREDHDKKSGKEGQEKKETSWFLKLTMTQS